MATWSVGAARDLPVDETSSFDGAAAKASIFDWAGGDEFDSRKARRGFLVYDADADDLKGSYKLPFATVKSGTLTAVKAGINNAASRLPQTDIPEETRNRARAVIDGYQAKWQEKALTPAWFTRRPDDREEELEFLRAVEGRLEKRAAVAVEPSEDGFSGYAATFMTADSYNSCFAKGCFRKSLKDRGDRLPVLCQHNANAPIGRHVSIKEDNTGLAVDVHLIDDGAEGTTTLKRLRGGVPLGLSFGFQTVKDRSADDEDEIDLSQLSGAKKADIRVITDVRLWETSVVTFAANEKASISAIRSDLPPLSTLLDAIRAGTLDEASLAQVKQIVAAYECAGAALVDLPESDGHATQDAARRQRQIALALALAKTQVVTGVRHA